jgi:C1A family cysteine protease
MNSVLDVSDNGRRYGLFRDNLNSPARKLLTLTAPSSIVLPPKASTSQWMGEIRDQGNEGSCTGQMGAEIRDLLYRKLFMFEKTRLPNATDYRASAAYVYKCNLIADGDLGHDNGSTIHQTFITLNQKGAPQELVAPYSDKDYSTAPTVTQVEEALKFKGGPYHYLPSLLEVKACINSGYSVGFGIDVYASFESDGMANSGLMLMPKEGEKYLGGHAQHGLDYDDAVKFPDGSVGGVLVQNSWGTKWGISAPGRTDRGCYWIPYAFFNTGHVVDMWMMHLGSSW